MSRVGQVKDINDMKGAGSPIGEIAEDPETARNMVRWYLTSPEAIRPNHRLRRTSNFGPRTEYVDCRLDEGLENCAVQHWELMARFNELVRQDFDAVRPVGREGGLPPTGSVPACAV